MRFFLKIIGLVTTAYAAGLATPTQAGEIYAGTYVHAVDTPFTFETEEGGVDFQLGYRLDPIEGIAGIQPYIFGSLNSTGDTSFVAIGFSRRFEIGTIYIRPGVGLALHDAPEQRVDVNGFRTDLGSRILFEPEIAVGTQISERFSLEASWVHISNAQILDSVQNPGIDMIGIRANLKL